jgi:acyl carrier protein
MNITSADKEAASAPTPREQLLALVRRIIGAPGANRPLAVDARLSELGITSIKMVTLMLAIEAEFDLTIPQSEITPESFATVASLEALVERIKPAS